MLQCPSTNALIIVYYTIIDDTGNLKFLFKNINHHFILSLNAFFFVLIRNHATPEIYHLQNL